MSETLLTLLGESSIRAGIMAALVAGVLWIARARTSAMSHAAWTAVVGAMLLMPALSWMVPAIPMPLPTPSLVTEAVTLDPAPIAPVSDLTMAPASSAALPAPTAARVRVSSPGPGAADRLSPRVAWPVWVLLAYACGVILFAARLLAGAFGLARIIRTARPLDRDVVVSPSVAVPLTAGVVRSRVVLPESSSMWTPDALAAVLAHERAHIARRDPLVLLLAHINRCVFWFHPLAWWLQRRLAAQAEYACDDAAIRVVGRRPYAELLVDLAGQVSRERRRAAWAGVGIDGAGLLRTRIERVLNGHPTGRLSKLRSAVAALACAAAIVAAVACRERVMPATLEPDPEVAARLAEQKARTDEFYAVRSMTAEQVRELEATVKANPDDVAGRRKLIGFYRWSGRQVDWNAKLEARRPHILWMIEHHPEEQLAVAGNVTPAFDPVGYAEVKERWLAHVARPDASAAVLSNAAMFLEVSDKPMAEKVLLRLESMDPGGPRPSVRNHVYYAPWRDRLGVLYALAVLGSNDETAGNVVKSTSAAEANSPFALHARNTLAQTSDPVLLAAAGAYLVRNAQNAKVAFDHKALGKSYLRRAMDFDPNSGAASTLQWVERADRHNQQYQALRQQAADRVGGDIARKVRGGERLNKAENDQLIAAQDGLLTSMTDQERFEYLLDGHVLRGEGRGRELLELAARFRTHPRHGDAIYDGNLALGLESLENGDVKGAVRHLEAAAAVPSISKERAAGSFFSNLPTYLLHNGERESVAAYFERAAELFPRERERLMKDAAAVRAGRMTGAYQHMYARPPDASMNRPGQVR